MELAKIIFDIQTSFSFGVYRQRGKLVSRTSILTWLSTKHNRKELKEIYPNTSLVSLTSPNLGNFEKDAIDFIVQNTRWIETDFYKIGILKSAKLDHYILDWKAKDCALNIKYQPLSRKDMLPRCLPLTIEIWREIRLDQIL